MIAIALALQVCVPLGPKPSLPETGDFVRGTSFRESEKQTLMKIIVFVRVM
jgi:hypothetical protein